MSKLQEAQLSIYDYPKLCYHFPNSLHECTRCSHLNQHLTLQVTTENKAVLKQVGGKTGIQDAELWSSTCRVLTYNTCCCFDLKMRVLFLPERTYFSLPLH
ncbi:hypothetical protein CHARACLAT_031387 [Characodon lateralis]|uniref:Uncharacterized protein n=1 Tax=Characodon lateralis TaxID=208331 RepID=A0ABU7EYE3_9TELE|nr:hypothetical protein [Characodon lateralis]